MPTQAVRDFYRKKEAASGAERRANDPTNWENKRRAFLEDARLNRLAEAENQRKLAQQALANQGQLDVTDRTQAGATTRTNLEQAGLNQRFADELGFKEREAGRRFTLDSGRLDLDRETTDSDFWYKYKYLKQLGDQATTSEKRLRDQMENELALKKEKLGLEKFNILYGPASEASLMTDSERMARIQNYNLLESMNDLDFLRNSLAEYDEITTPAPEGSPQIDAQRDLSAENYQAAQRESRLADIPARITPPADQRTFQNQAKNTSFFQRGPGQRPSNLGARENLSDYRQRLLKTGPYAPNRLAQ